MRRTNDQVGPKYRPITSEYLDYEEVMERYDAMMDWLAKTLCRDLKPYPLYA